MKTSFGKTMAAYKRAIGELHQVTPALFPIMTLSAIVAAVIPYVTVFFSAQILRELALLRRAEVLWKWVAAGVAATGGLAILNAVLHQRRETLLDDVWGRKEILFCRKAFSMDFADIDKQENRDLRAQIAQNENWAGWGFGQVAFLYEYCMKSVIGVLSGAALTVSLFTARVPESAGWLTALNHPLFILLFAGVMVGISLLAGKLSVKSRSYWSGASEDATFGNRVYGYFGFIGEKRERAADIRMRIHHLQGSAPRRPGLRSFGWG